MVHSLLNKVILSKSFLIDTVLIGKDSDAGRDWGQKEKGTTENEMAGWHHWLDGCESERTPGVGDGQGGLACCDSWGHKESDTTERLNWTVMNLCLAWWECIFLLQNLYWGKLAFIKSNMDRRYFPIGFCVCVCVCVSGSVCDPIDCSSPGPSVPKISWARILGSVPFPNLGNFLYMLLTYRINTNADLETFCNQNCNI